MDLQMLDLQILDLQILGFQILGRRIPDPRIPGLRILRIDDVRSGISVELLMTLGFQRSRYIASFRRCQLCNQLRF
jgi:hypothetical protein